MGLTWPEVLARLSRREALSEAEAEETLKIVLSGEATPAQVGAFLSLLHAKGETAEEVTGLARAMVGAAVAKFGGLDCLHNNAAATKMHRDSDVVNVATEVWDETMAVNLRGPFFGCRYAIPEMLKRGGGAIVNTSSAAGLKAERIRVSYGVSKAALHGLTRHVANAYGKQNVRCNAIALGMILTEAAERNVPEEMLTFLETNNALARLGKTADVAEVVAFLFSDEASFISGEVIAVDGGFTSHLPALVD